MKLDLILIHVGACLTSFFNFGCLGHVEEISSNLDSCRATEACEIIKRGKKGSDKARAASQ